jgi:cyclic-di-GMP phosphodiesterase TipF (flagellum assembly factor)
MSHVLLFAVYAIAGLAVGYGFPVFAPTLGSEAAPAAGVALFALAGFLHTGLALSALRCHRARGLGEAADAQTALANRVTELEDTLDTLRGEIKRRDQNDARVNQEMRVLQGLVAQLNAKKAAKTLGAQERDVIAGAVRAGPKLAQRRRASGLVTSSEKLRGTFPPVQIIENLTDEQVLEYTREALGSNRIDLYVQPIVTLPQRKVKYYEAFSRLRDSSGRMILPERYIPVAVEAGLITTIDNLLLFRCVQMIRNLRKESIDIGFFYNLSTHSLNDHEFLAQFVEYMDLNRDLAGTLIFELSESDLSNASVDSSLAKLAKMEFTFSLDHVTSIGIDFPALAHHNFRFFKMDAGKMLGQMKSSKDKIHPADLREAMEREKIALIADRVEEEKTVIELLDYNVGLAQGFLFGEPRTSRESVS